MTNTPIKVIQANVRRCANAQKELVNHFVNNDYSIALISEPFVGRGTIVRTMVGIDVFQFSTTTGPVKACVLMKQSFGSALGLTQYSSSNLAVVQISIRQRKLLFASVYIEPDDDTNNTFTKLTKFVFDNQGQSIVIGGDVNGNHQDWGCLDADERGNSLAALAASHQLNVCNIGNDATYEEVRSGVHMTSIVDVTLASGNVVQNIIDWRVRPDVCTLSDHHAIEFGVDAGSRPGKSVRSSTYLFNNKIADWNAFESSVRKNMRDSGLTDINIDTLDEDSLDDFVVSMTDAIRDSCFATMRLRGFPKPFNPWWNDALERHKKNCLTIHHRLNQKKARNHDISNEIRDFHAAKKAYASAIRKASTANFREFCKNQGKEDVWSKTSRLIKDAPSKRPPSTLKLGNNFTTSAQQTADELARHFYPDDDADLIARHHELRARVDDRPQSPDEPDFTSDEVIDCLKTMSPNRAPGHDNLTSDICLHFTQIFPTLVTNLMNRCLHLGHFPTYWKLAVVKILPKPGREDYTVLTSFRPIGLLTIFSKLLEKLFVRRLTYNARTRGMWSAKQYGFREQSSTVDALNNAIEVIKTAKSGPKPGRREVLAVSLDIKAAFDNAWWPAIFERLRRTGCPNNIYKLVQSYFLGRSVRLRYADAETTKVMTRGCVQGSVCGPTFWNVILDELLETPLPEGCHIQAFADDVLLLVTGEDANSVQDAANRALAIISDWGTSVKLSFSPTKTKAVAFTNQAARTNIFMDGVHIPFEDSFKLLGVTIDNKLKFVQHVRIVLRKASAIFKNLCKFVRPTWGVHSENVAIIYRQVIEPIITYAAEIWGGVVQLDYVRQELRSFQRPFAIRTIRGFHTVSAVSAIAMAKFTPLHLKIREIHDIGRVKRTGLAPSVPDDITMERRARPDELPHPSKRHHITINIANNQSEADAFASDVNIYTDGSKSDDGVGAAFVVKGPGRDVIRKFRLNAVCSVFQAEMLALNRALAWLVRNPAQNVTIYSDSQSSLKALSSTSNTNFFVNECRKTLDELPSTTVVQFVWVKAHVGIIGNELADEAAKAASNMHSASSYNAFPLSLAKRIIRAYNFDEWADEYANSSTGSGTRSWFPTLLDVHRGMDAFGTSFELTQIFTGHGFHKEYLKRFHITADDVCPCDGRTTQSIDHLIKDCNRFASGRFGYRTQCSLIRATPFDITSPDDDARTLFKEFVSSIVSQLKDFNN